MYSSQVLYCRLRWKRPKPKFLVALTPHRISVGLHFWQASYWWTLFFFWSVDRSTLRQPEKRLKLFDTVSVSPTLCPTFSNFSNFVSPGSFSILPHLIKPQTSLINSKFKKGWTVFPPFNPVKSVQKSDYRTTGAKTNQTVILQIRIFDRPKIKWPETWQQT